MALHGHIIAKEYEPILQDPIAIVVASVALFLPFPFSR